MQENYFKVREKPVFEYVNLVQENQVDINEQMGKMVLTSVIFHSNLLGQKTLQACALILYNDMKSNQLYPEVLFIHIQKTAGTSILEYARSKYHDNMVTHGDFLNMDMDQIHKTAFVSGHFGFDYIESLLKYRYSFTFLRDPIERILSLYYFCRHQPKSEFPIYRFAQELDLEKFLQAGFEPGRIKSHIWNHQTWMLACGRNNTSGLEIEKFNSKQLLDRAIINLGKLSHVGFVESFDNDLSEIVRELGLHNPEKKISVNVTKNHVELNR